MTSDKFVAKYIGEVKLRLNALQHDIATANFTDMYSVGKLQGRFSGLQESLAILEQIYADADV